MGFWLEFQEEVQKNGEKYKYALQADMNENTVTVKVKNSTNNNLTIVS